MLKITQQVIDHLSTVLVGKQPQIKLALACLFARGHLLIEDLPGMGKTTLAHGLARTFGLAYSRVQFTSDLLPADILGISILDTTTNQFSFNPGPIFNQLVLADEINRTTPKTQSALLEAMAEGQVTVDGETRQLPSPFFVIATQNPVNQLGTYVLPESQQDRFLMCISLGYPDRNAERALLAGHDAQAVLKHLSPILTPEQLQQIQQAVDKISVSDALLDYLQNLISYTREHPSFSYGLSPRGALALLQAAKSWAFMASRRHVVPEDIQAVFVAVAGHRVKGAGEYADQSTTGLLQTVLNNVDTL